MRVAEKLLAWAVARGLALGLVDAQLPGLWKNWIATFTTTNAALAKVLADVTPAFVQAAVASEGNQPGEGSLRQRVMTGGQRIINGSIASTDGTARSIVFWKGVQASLYANMGAVTTTATNVINRTVGSFVTDGFLVGDQIMQFGAPTTGNNGVVGVVTGVTATTLTVNGTPWTNETMGAGYRVFRVSQWTRRAVALNSGNTDTAPPIQLLGNTQDPSAFPAPDTGMSLAADAALICGMTAAISALPAQVTVNAEATLY